MSLDRYRVKQEGAWCSLEAARSASIELTLPAAVCVARRADGHALAGYQVTPGYMPSLCI